MLGSIDRGNGRRFLSPTIEREHSRLKELRAMIKSGAMSF